MADRMPALFIGHGNPMNAIEDNVFSRAWAELGETLPRPNAILSISAHWETAGTCITAMTEPATLYDFNGFPKALYAQRYPAPGAPGLARRIKSAMADPILHLDFSWGLDHGTWSVLCRMFPAADIPVLQLSLDFDQPAEYHYQLGRKLRYLRGEGILVIGSGNMVHNLRTMVWEDIGFDWASAFDAKLAGLIRNGDHQPIIDYRNLGEAARLAVPTSEHFLPLLYVLAMQLGNEIPSFLCEKVTLGSVSMRSLILGHR